jgi:hypothetical protein
VGAGGSKKPTDLFLRALIGSKGERGSDDGPRELGQP